MNKYTLTCKSIYDEIYEIWAENEQAAIDWLVDGNDMDSQPREFRDSVFNGVIPRTIEVSQE